MIWIELLYYAATVLIIIGAFLNAYKYRESFLLWVVSGVILLWQSFTIKAYNLTLLNTFFILMAIFAFYKWSKN